MKYLALIFLLLFSMNSFSQSLLGDGRIRKITPRKKSIYLDKGIFHNGTVKNSSSINSIRHHFSKKRNYERIVFDFSTQKNPRIYGHISGNESKLYIDFFDTKVKNSIDSFGDSIYVKDINFYPMIDDVLSVEIVFKENVKVDIFYLESPARLVIDIKK